MRYAPITLATSVELYRERNKSRPAHHRDRTIYAAGKAKHPRQGRSRNQKNAVDQDLAFRSCLSGNDRQHGHTRPGIFLHAIERERPEVRWRPEEDDTERRKRL